MRRLIDQESSTTGAEDDKSVNDNNDNSNHNEDNETDIVLLHAESLSELAISPPGTCLL